MNKPVMPDDIIKTVKTFLSYTDGDEALERFVLAMGADILGISVDKLIELI